MTNITLLTPAALHWAVDPYHQARVPVLQCSSRRGKLSARRHCRPARASSLPLWAPAVVQRRWPCL